MKFFARKVVTRRSLLTIQEQKLENCFPLASGTIPHISCACRRQAHGSRSATSKPNMANALSLLVVGHRDKVTESPGPSLGSKASSRQMTSS